MTFANEKIPASEIEQFGIVYTAPDGTKIPLSSHWTIDREADAVLYFRSKVGGPYEGTQVTKYYSLRWEGAQIDLAADPGPKTYPIAAPVMTWRIHSLRIPPSLKERTEEIQRLIRNAFTVMGDAYNGEQFETVSAEFDHP